MGLFSNEPLIISDENLRTTILDMWRDAKEQITIVSPYLDFADKSRNIWRELVGASKRNVKITLFIRDESENKFKKDAYPPPDVNKFLEELQADVFAVPDLHSKIFIIDDFSLITSINLLHSSLNSSHEIGVGFDSSNKKMTAELDTYIEFLESHAKPIGKKQNFKRAPFVTRNKISNSSPNSFTSPAKGYCIRCSASIPINIKVPYCDTHLESWNRYKDREYQEKKGVCHGCGKPNIGSMAIPFCRTCYAKYAK